MPTVGLAQSQPDTDAINRLIDRYIALDDSMDLAAQAKLMAPDRVWIAQGEGRRTDQALGMRLMQAQYDVLKKQVPGIQMFGEARDRLVKFYGNGLVAVASFYRYTTLVSPPNTPLDLAKELGSLPAAAWTMVLEKRDGQWKIVHTHNSRLGPGS
jgi:uncharacterized protein (TIGR02246 family)